MNRAELKLQAKQQIKGNIGILFLIILIYAAISVGLDFILSFIPYGEIISAVIVVPAFTLSIIRVYLNLAQNIKPKAVDAFSGFNDFWSAFKVSFLVGIFSFLWSLLFVIPGIVKSYSYLFSTYILAENKNKPALECINESKAMTNGHKMELFVLHLSFIGWILLIVATLGIAAIWVSPYMQATFTNAYNMLKPKKTEVVCETPVIEENPTQE